MIILSEKLDTDLSIFLEIYKGLGSRFDYCIIEFNNPNEAGEPLIWGGYSKEKNDIHRDRERNNFPKSNSRVN
jgi:hypothetical protein